MRLQRRVRLPAKWRAERAAATPAASVAASGAGRARPRGWRTAAMVVAGAVAGGVIAVAAVPAYRAVAQNYASISTVSITSAQQAVNGPAVAIFKKLSPSIVLVTNKQTVNGTLTAAAWGSGVIFNSAGYIVTNDHVVNGATALSVTLADGTVYTAHLVGGDPSTDLAVIKISAPNALPAATFANSNDVVPGEFAVAIGNPLGPQFAQSVTQGIVGAVRPMLYGLNTAAMRVTKMIQTDAPINPGNSGGALANAQGDVIGITSMKVANSGGTENITTIGLGFAIPSNTVEKIVNQLVRYGYVKRAWLGVYLQETPSTNTLPNQKQTITITQVQGYGTHASPAAGKLQTGDVITAWNGQTVLNGYDLVEDINAAQPGQTVKITVLRSGKSVTVPVTLGQEPRSLEDQVASTVSSSSSSGSSTSPSGSGTGNGSGSCFPYPFCSPYGGSPYFP